MRILQGTKSAPGSRFVVFCLVVITFILSGGFVAAQAINNLIPNFSFETRDGANPIFPASWSTGNWGSNSAQFSLAPEGEDGTTSSRIDMSSYSDGDAKWYFAPVSISGGSQYAFSDFYKSNVDTSVVAQFTAADGSLSYLDVISASPASSDTWKGEAAIFTAPSSAQKVTLFHLINKAGWLETDALTLTSTSSPVIVVPPAPVPPPVAPVIPQNPGINLINNPSVETAGTGSPSPLYWGHNAWGTNTSNFTYLSTGRTGGKALSTAMTSYGSGDAKWFFDPIAVTAGTRYTYTDFYQSSIASTLFAAFSMTDGSMQYLELGTLPSSSEWKESSASFVTPTGVASVTVYHVIAGVGTLSTDDFSLTVADLPSVSMIAPAQNASVSGITQLGASASDASGIASVQFAIDGVSVGGPVSTAPYFLIWNSPTVSNGTHVVTAIATNVNGKTATSNGLTIMVANALPQNGNLVPNPSLENTVNNLPQDWTSSKWGTSSTTFAFLATGHTGAHSGKITMSGYTDGDAKWFFAPVNVTLDTQYQFSDYYQATVATEVDVAFLMSDGTTVYQLIGLPEPATTWTQFSTKFSVPLGAKSMTIYHLIHSNGSLTIDDEDIRPYTPVGFNRPIVSLTFDDGYDNMITQAQPLLTKYGFTSTQFIITNTIGKTGYLTKAQLKSLFAAGNEIASHTVTHNNMLKETPAQIISELSLSKSRLQQWTNATVTDLAFPNGLYNKSIVASVKNYYKAARGIEDGLNGKDNFNLYNIRVQNIYSWTTPAQVADWVKQAQQTNTWLVLTYHSIDPNTASTIDGGIYNITPTDLDQQLSMVKASGVAVMNMDKALLELIPQTGN